MTETQDIGLLIKATSNMPTYKINYVHVLVNEGPELFFFQRLAGEKASHYSQESDEEIIRVILVRADPDTIHRYDLTSSSRAILGKIENIVNKCANSASSDLSQAVHDLVRSSRARELC